jgi:anti-sigma factor RsiW
MNPTDPQNSTDPTPEHLAAYLDGQLDVTLREKVEAWLAEHPEQQAELDAQRRLAQLWQSAAPPEPAESAWSALLARIEQGVAQQAEQAQPQSREPRRRVVGLVWTAVMVAAASAAIVVGVLVGPGLTPQPPLVERVATFPVAAPGDVEILSMHDADSGALVVGEPPVRGKLVVAVAEDVSWDEFGDDVEVIHGWEGVHGPMAPMIRIPLDPPAAKVP